MEIGDLGGGNGSYQLNAGNLNIGTNATDAVTFSLGATLGSTGTLTQTGGTLTIGSSTTANGTTFNVGVVGTGTYTITGGTAIFNNALTMGSTGTVNLNGGTIDVATSNFSGPGTLNFGGGTLKLTSGTTFTDSFAGGALSTGISTIDASVGTFTTVTIGQNLSGAGGINFIGTDGTHGNALTIFTFTGTNTYTGATEITGGTLDVTADQIRHSSALGIFATSNSVGTLNLSLGGTSFTYGGVVTGTGNLNVNFNAAAETLALTNTSNAVGSINVVLGANTGPNASLTPGTLQVYSGNFGNISEVGVGNSVTIGANTGLGSVTFGTASYTGLTTVNPNYTLSATKLDGNVLNNGGLSVTGAGGAGGISGNVTNNGTLFDASGIGGTVMNTGTLQVLGAAGIGGAVTNSGTLQGPGRGRASAVR